MSFPTPVVMGSENGGGGDLSRSCDISTMLYNNQSVRIDCIVMSVIFLKFFLHVCSTLNALTVMESILNFIPILASALQSSLSTSAAGINRGNSNGWKSI